MRGILEFSLPEEEDEFLLASSAGKFYSALHEIDTQVRGWLKYGNDFKSHTEALLEVRRLIHTEMEDRNLSFDMVK